MSKKLNDKELLKKADKWAEESGGDKMNFVEGKPIMAYYVSQEEKTSKKGDTYKFITLKDEAGDALTYWSFGLLFKMIENDNTQVGDRVYIKTTGKKKVGKRSYHQCLFVNITKKLKNEKTK